jgi:two-component system, NarL family, response regulator LiaR
MTNPKIRVLIADDHGLLREGLSRILDGLEDMELVGEARDGEEAVQKALALVPDVLLIDLMMPRKSGIEAIREIKAQNPKIRILVLTSSSEEDHIFPAIEAGALGYMLKDISAANLLQAIRIVSQDQPSLSPDVAMKLMKRYASRAEVSIQEELLTPREEDVLVLIAKGFSNKEVASRLGLSDPTVRTHVSSILGKLGLTNRTQAALYAIRQGLVSFDD